MILLEQTVASIVKNLAPAGIGPLDELAKNIGVKDILRCDSSSTSLPDGASDDFPAPRKDIAPAAFKWHNCMSLVSGLIVWWSMTAVKVNYRKSFPPLKVLLKHRHDRAEQEGLDELAGEMPVGAMAA